MEESGLVKRVVVFQNGMGVDGKVIIVTDSLESVLNECSQKLQIKAKKLFTKNGGLIDDVNLIRDDDVLYVSDGNDFINIQSSDQLKSVHISPPHVCSPGHSRGQGQSDWVTLNVGGQLFTTTRSTLVTKDPESMLARMFVSDTDIQWSSTVDSSGAYLFDRSPKYFEPILNFLRHGQLILDKNVNPEGILEEAKFFGITSLIEQLEDLVAEDVPESDHSPITRREFILRLLSVPTSTELRCQGLNFTGANLSRLDLRCINFKYAILRHTNLSGANLSHCNFERADMCKALLDGANLLGVKMLCVNLEAASLRGCNFEDPAGSRANMEGAQMKNVNLESSHMAGVNLRVATLKNANLQNCDLRGAVLAGADLENCDLSGCDLQEANLRGANLKGAAFELMLNPLHMAQAMSR